MLTFPEKPIGYLHFRTVETERYEIWRDDTSGACWYEYPPGSAQKYNVYIPTEYFTEPPKTGWAAFVLRAKQPTNEKNEKTNDNIMVVISAEFSFDKYAETIRMCVQSGHKKYPPKYVVKKGTEPPQFIDNQDGTKIEIPIEYIDAVLKKQDEMSKMFSS